MEPLFTATTEYTFEKYRRFAQTIAMKYQKLHIRVAVLELVSVCAFIAFRKRNWNLASVFLFFIVVFPFSIYFEQRGRIKKAWESNRMAQHSLYTMEFYRDHLLRSTDRANTSIDYRDLYDIVETDDSFYIMISNNQGLMLDKSACSDELCAHLKSIRNDK